MRTFEIIGWIGAVSYLLAYWLLSNGKMHAKQRVYQLMNILGAACLMANALCLSDWPNFVTNLLWGGIGALAYYRIVFPPKPPQAQN